MTNSAEIKRVIEDLLEDNLHLVVDVDTKGLGYVKNLERIARASLRLVEALESLKKYHEVAKGDMYKRNWNWVTANEALAEFMKDISGESKSK